MRVLKSSEPGREELSPELARRRLIRYFALWAPIAFVAVLLVMLFVTPLYNLLGGGDTWTRRGTAYGAPCVLVGVGMAYLFWQRLTRWNRPSGWTLIGIALSVSAVIALLGAFLSHLISPIEGAGKWTLPGGIVGAAALWIFIKR